MKYAVLVRDYHTAIPSLLYTENEENAIIVLKALKELESPKADVTDEAYWQYSEIIWDTTINPLIIDTEEVNRRDIDNGFYSDVEIVNDIPVDTF